MARLVEKEKQVKQCMSETFDVMIALAREKDAEAVK